MFRKTKTKTRIMYFVESSKKNSHLINELNIFVEIILSSATVLYCIFFLLFVIKTIKFYVLMYHFWPHLVNMASIIIHITWRMSFASMHSHGQSIHPSRSYSGCGFNFPLDPRPFLVRMVKQRGKSDVERESNRRSRNRFAYITVGYNITGIDMIRRGWQKKFTSVK